MIDNIFNTCDKVLNELGQVVYQEVEGKWYNFEYDELGNTIKVVSDNITCINTYDDETLVSTLHVDRVKGYEIKTDYYENGNRSNILKRFSDSFGNCFREEEFKYDEHENVLSFEERFYYEDGSYTVKKNKGVSFRGYFRC